MADAKRIHEALSKLNKDNDAHWTSDGMPRLDTIRLLASDQTISREDVSKVAPDFARANPVLAQQGAQQAAQAEPAPAPAQPTNQSPAPALEPGPSPTTVSGAGPIEESLDEGAGEGPDDDMASPALSLEQQIDALVVAGIPVGEVRAELARARENLDDLTSRANKAREMVAEQQVEVDALTTLLAKLVPDDSANAIGRYLAQQRAQIDVRVSQHRELVSSGHSAKEAARILNKFTPRKPQPRK